LIPATANEHTRTLKLLTKARAARDRIERQVKYILGQGLDKSGASIGNGESFTQIGGEVTLQQQVVPSDILEDIHEGDLDDDIYDALELFDTQGLPQSQESGSKAAINS